MLILFACKVGNFEINIPIKYYYNYTIQSYDR